jgi:hypothetical protein
VAALGSAAAANPTETFRYRACVTDSDGHAIAGAVVEAYQYPEQGRSPDPELMTNLTICAEGKFEITPRPYSPLVTSSIARSEPI